jgi:hypothetical protein
MSWSTRFSEEVKSSGETRTKGEILGDHNRAYHGNSQIVATKNSVQPMADVLPPTNRRLNTVRPLPESGELDSPMMHACAREQNSDANFKEPRRGMAYRCGLCLFQAARRSQRWCSPPTCGTATTELISGG